jgi:hypothetical protein
MWRPFVFFVDFVPADSYRDFVCFVTKKIYLQQVLGSQRA